MFVVTTTPRRRYVQTGNLHIAIYDHANMFMHVATARSDGEGGELNAFQRQFMRLNMTHIFAEPRPTLMAMMPHGPGLLKTE